MTGLMAARYLSDDPNLAIDLLERTDRLGGLHHSPQVKGRIYDVGAYAFTAKDLIFEAFPGLLGHYQPFQATYRTVLDGGELDGFPRTLRGYARRHGPAHMVRAALDLAIGKVVHRRRDSVPAYCQYYLGRSFYQRSGLRNYIERLFCRADHAIDIQFARQRLQAIQISASLRGRTRAALRRLHTPRSPRAPRLSYARPRDGFGHCYGIVERELLARGVNVLKSCSVGSIEKRDGMFILQTADGAREYDHVISTIPVPTVARLVGFETEARFDTMTLVTLFYRYAGENAGYDAVYLYNFSHRGRWKRVIDFSAIYGDRTEGRWISVEITRPADEPRDADRERLDFEATVRELGLFAGSELAFQGHHSTPNAYPIFDRDSAAALDRDRARIEAWGIRIVGRQGRFDYISSAEGAEAARDLARAMREGQHRERIGRG